MKLFIGIFQLVERLFFLVLWLKVRKKNLEINLEEHLIEYLTIKTNFLGYNINIPLINIANKETKKFFYCAIYPFKIKKSGRYQVQHFGYGDYTFTR